MKVASFMFSCIAATGPFAGSSGPLSLPFAGKPPIELVSGGSCYADREYENDASTGRNVTLGISADTLGKKVLLRWRCRNSSTSIPALEIQKEAVAFWPTALCYSWSDDHVVYVAGRNSQDKPVLEKWTIGTDFLMTESAVQAGQTGVGQTSVSTPTIDRDVLPIDPAIGQVSSIAINPWTLPGAEEVWLLDWTAKIAWGVSPSTGARTQRVALSAIGSFQTVTIRQHSIVGGVIILQRRPWHVEAASWIRSSVKSPNLDPDFLVEYDNNMDGVIDGSEVIVRATMMQHQLYSTGNWLH